MKPFAYNNCAAFYPQALVHKANLFCPCQILTPLQLLLYTSCGVTFSLDMAYILCHQTFLYPECGKDGLDFYRLPPTFICAMVLFTFYVFYLCVRSRVRVSAHVPQCVCVEVKGQRAGALAFHHVISQVYRLGHKCLYLLSPGLCFECKMLSMCSYFEYLISN